MEAAFKGSIAWTFADGVAGADLYTSSSTARPPGRSGPSPPPPKRERAEASVRRGGVASAPLSCREGLGPKAKASSAAAASGGAEAGASDAAKEVEAEEEEEEEAESEAAR